MRVAPFFLICALASCGGGDDGPTSPFIRGQVVQAAALSGVSYFGDLAVVDAVWAIPVNGGSVESGSLRERVELPLEEDGSFVYTPSYDGDYDVLFALVNTANCMEAKSRVDWIEDELDRRLECIQGFVSVPDAESNGSMLRIPANELEAPAELGKVTPAPDGEARTDINLTTAAESFSLDLARMRAIARTDDTLKSFAYLYANMDDTGTDNYSMHVLFNWHDTLGATRGLSDPANFQTDGYYVSFDTNVDAASVPTNQPGYLKLYPPATVSLSIDGNTTTDYGPTNPIDIYYEVNDGILAGTAGVFQDISPAGEWKLTRGGDTGPVVSKFDLSFGAPFDLVDGVADVAHPKLYIPQVFASESGGKVTDLTLSFKIFDGTNYVDLPREFVMSQVRSLNLGIAGDAAAGCPAEGGEGIRGDFMTSDTWSPEGAWTFDPGDATTCGVSRIDVSYFIMGTLYQFSFTDEFNLAR